jgi:hypothetical protein
MPLMGVPDAVMVPPGTVEAARAAVAPKASTASPMSFLFMMSPIVIDGVVIFVRPERPHQLPSSPF